jgi:hypothetical protein
MIERRVRDFRLDTRLRKYCQQDIISNCGMLESIGGDETDVSDCLQVGWEGRAPGARSTMLWLRLRH